MRSLTSSLIIDNLNYSALQTTSGLLTALEAALKAAIAGGLGHGVTPGSVDLNLYACSLAVHASISPPTSAAFDLSKSNLDFSNTLLQKVAAEIRGVKGIEAASACGTAVNVRRVPPSAIEVAAPRGEEVKACVDSIFQKAKEKTRSKLQECPLVSASSGCNQLPEPPKAVAVAADSAKQLWCAVASDCSPSPKPRMPRRISTMEPQDADALQCLQGVRCNGAWVPRDGESTGEPGEGQSRRPTSPLKVARDASLAQQRVEQLQRNSMEQQHVHNLPGSGGAAETAFCHQMVKGGANMAAVPPLPSSSCAEVTTAAEHATPRATPCATSTPLEPAAVQHTAGPADARAAPSISSLTSGKPSLMASMTPMPAKVASDVLVAKDYMNTGGAVLDTSGAPSAARPCQQPSSGDRRAAAAPATPTPPPQPRPTLPPSPPLPPHIHNSAAKGGVANTTARQQPVKGKLNRAAPQNDEVATAAADATQRYAAYARTISSSPRSFGGREAGAGHVQSGVATSNQQRTLPNASPVQAFTPIVLATPQGNVAGDMDAKFQLCQGQLRRAGDALRVEHLRLRRTR